MILSTTATEVCPTTFAGLITILSTALVIVLPTVLDTETVAFPASSKTFPIASNLKLRKIKIKFNL